MNSAKSKIKVISITHPNDTYFVVCDNGGIGILDYFALVELNFSGDDDLYTDVIPVSAEWADAIGSLEVYINEYYGKITSLHWSRVRKVEQNSGDLLKEHPEFKDLLSVLWGDTVQ